jgi:MFS family permease
MGFIGGAYGFTQFILRIPVGISADKWQKKFFICAGCLFAGFAALCMYIFHNPTGFLIGRALGGIAASSWVPCSVLYTSYYKPEHATRSITMINLANQSGRLVSFLAAGLLAASFGPESAFLIAAIGGFIGFFISLFVYEEKVPINNETVTFRKLLSVGKDKKLLITSTLTVFVQIIAFATISTFAANHAVNIGANPAQIGYMQVMLLAPSLVLSFCLSKYILQRVEAKYLIILGFIITALYCFILTFTSTIAMLYMVQMIGGLGNTLTFSLLMGLSVQNVPTENRGVAMGFFQAIYGIGMTIGPLIMGVLTDSTSLRFGFLCMAVLAAVSSIISGIFLKKQDT